MDLCLTAYSLAHSIGYLPTRDGEPCPRPLDAIGIMDAGVEMGLAGVELPLSGTDATTIERLRGALLERGLSIITDYLVLDAAGPESFRAFLRASSRLGAKTVRSILSTILCGDRRITAGAWPDRLDAAARFLRDVLPEAQDLGLCLTLENHQDATTDDLVRLADAVHHHPAFGVCLDTGNPLAVGEGPVESARLLAPLVRHAHLKDYTIHFCPEGYRLVRCAAGEGVVDFPAILSILKNIGHPILPGIEVAWHATRTIPLLEESWWSQYPPRDATTLLPAMKLLWARGRPADEPYSGSWERGESSNAVCAEEWDVLRRTVKYFEKYFHDPFSGDPGG